jgi:hypothetical protein
MKVAAIVLGLFLGWTQTISFTNCCQGSFCPQKDNCPACPENKASGSDDCCGKGIPPKAGDPGCVHLEPSVEVDSGITPDHDFLAAAWVELVTQSIYLLHGEGSEGTLLTSAESPPEDLPPLYLRNLALLI